MNSQKSLDLKNKYCPNIEYKKLIGWKRHDIIQELSENNNIGIELGVAKGIYSKRMLESNKFQRFYGVDIYGDKHDTKEYIQALNYINFQDSRYSLLRCDFDSAIDLFPDNYFDFIYIDGYAHTGEEGGKTIIDWYKKLKVGGIIAGDDYHEDWPLVIWAVNDFILQTQELLSITSEQESSEYSKYPTWFIKKTKEIDNLKVNPALYEIAMEEKARIHELRNAPPKETVQKMNKNNISISNSHFFFETNVFQDITVTHEEPIYMERCFVYGNTKIGAYTYFSHSSIYTLKSIGRFCSIAPGVKIGMGEHPIDYLSSHPIFYKSPYVFQFNETIEQLKSIGTPRTPDIIKEEPIIGNDVWIGANVVIARGVRIGDGAIIGANSLVNKDVPPYAVVAGSPANIIRFRFSEQIIEELLNLKWWNYSLDVLKNKPTNNIEEIIAYLKDTLPSHQPVNYNQWAWKNNQNSKIN